MRINFEKYGIDPSKVRVGKTVCPKCSHTRKNRNDKCLSVDLATGMFNCHNAGCNFKGCAAEFNRPRREYVNPQEKLSKLGSKPLLWFESVRGITNYTLLKFKITEAKEWMPQVEKERNCICFNYFRKEKLVNIKFRDAEKNFKLVKGAELIFYNLDSIAREEEAIIVEGEIDCLSVDQCGFHNVVSVPNGASLGSARLEYLDNCFDEFQDKKKIIIATDNDEAGRALCEELARRLGKERCYKVSYPDDCKDMNEVMLKHGSDGVKVILQTAEEYPLEGIVDPEDIYQFANEWYYNGYPKGADTKIDGFSEYLRFAPGQLTTITGIPGHGKDEFTNLIMTNLCKNEKWKFGIAGFEETPAQSATKIIEKFVGKSFDFRVEPNHRMTIDEFNDGMLFVADNFKFINTEQTACDLDSILTLAEQLVGRYGIKGFCLNPWNWVDHSRDGRMTETEYISGCLTKILVFAKRFGVHFFLIAHTTKIQKDRQTNKYEIPTLYSIAGSANFFNKTSNGICVYRHFDTGQVEVHVQKVKQSWLGKTGMSLFGYNTYTRQYYKMNNGM